MIRGIINVGNTCYMNSVLQLLFNGNLLFFTEEWRNFCNVDKITLELSKIINSNDIIINPKLLKNKINEEIEMFNNYDHQDAHEFLIQFLDKINDECGVKTKYELKKIPECIVKYNKYKVLYEETKNKTYILKMNKLKEYYKIDFIINNGLEYIAQFYKKKYNPYNYLFMTFNVSIIVCDNCDYESITYESINTISVDIYDDFEQSLNSYFDVHKLDDNYKCDKCNKHGCCNKKINIYKYPKYLFIHLKRFKLNGRRYDKNTQNIHIQENINIRKYLIKPQNIEYRMTGYVNHYGNIEGGHYTATCLKNNKWILFDDSTVSNTEYNTSNAYILMYKLN